jgi:cobalamin biosynthesis Mg chelatase CobN
VSDQTPEEIQAEIEQQREQLAGTLDALSEKLDVKTQAQAKVAQVKDRATTETGRPRTEVLLLGATVVVVAVALVWWRRR